MKRVILFFLTTAIIVNSNAQAKFGIKAGVNIPSLTGDDVDAGDFDGKTGFYAGGTVEITVSEHFSIQPELLFSTKGYSYMELGTKFTSTFNYIIVPVLARYSTVSGFYAETGPEIGFLLSAKRKGGNIPGDDDIKDAFKSSAFSWGAGLGYNLESGLGFGARYNFGLNSISDNSNTDAKFNVLRIGLSWTFGCANKSKDK